MPLNVQNDRMLPARINARQRIDDLLAGLSIAHEHNFTDFALQGVASRGVLAEDFGFLTVHGSMNL